MTMKSMKINGFTYRNGPAERYNSHDSVWVSHVSATQVYYIRSGNPYDHAQERGESHPRISDAGLNFINVLCAAFTLADPESVKKYW